MLESNFGGTTLRDIAAEFELKRDTVNKRYALTGDIQQLVEPVVIKRVLLEINRLFAQSDSTGYTGTVYFDRYIDSAIVDVRPISGDRGRCSGFLQRSADLRQFLLPANLFF